MIFKSPYADVTIPDVPLAHFVLERIKACVEQYYWHRPLHVLLNSAFSSGLVMDRLEEPQIKTEEPSKNAFDWSNYDMPPLLFARLRPAR